MPNSGYITRTYRLLKSDPKSTVLYTLPEDEAMMASIGSDDGVDIANKWFDVTCRKGLTEDQIWKRLMSVCTNYFDNIEVRDKSAGWIKSSWRLSKFKYQTVRTRIEIRMSFTLSSYGASALPDELGEDFGKTVFSVTDPEFEWSQIDTKKVKVSFKSQALQFESKLIDGFAYSVTELPIDVEDTPDFMFGFTLNGFKPSDASKTEKLSSKLTAQIESGNSGSLMSGSFGMLFDYQDIRNYKAIAISKKVYQYYVVKDGVPSIIKSGPVKYKGDSFKLIMKRENGGIEFVLNGIEVCKLRKISLSSSYFGAFINGTGKAEMPSFIMYVPEQEDTEQSTSDI